MIAAPATTGPAQGPRPASSTPATVAYPRPNACRSKTQRSRSAFGGFGRFFGCFSVGGDAAGNGLTLLSDAGTLPNFPSEVIQFGSAHLAVPDQVDPVDARRVQQEAALNPDAVRDAANAEALLGGAPPATDHDAFEDLDPLAGALDHLGMHLHRVTRSQGRDIGPVSLGLQQVDDVGHGVQGYHSPSAPTWFSRRAAICCSSASRDGADGFAPPPAPAASARSPRGGRRARPREPRDLRKEAAGRN